MSAVATTLRPVPVPASDVLRRGPAAQAYMLLRITFTWRRILFGLDKFAGLLTDDWTREITTRSSRGPWRLSRTSRRAARVAAVR